MFALRMHLIPLPTCAQGRCHSRRRTGIVYAHVKEAGRKGGRDCPLPYLVTSLVPIRYGEMSCTVPHRDKNLILPETDWNLK